MSSVPSRLLTEQEYLARERKAEFKSEFYRGEMFAMAGASREHNLGAESQSRRLVEARISCHEGQNSGNQLAYSPDPNITGTSTSCPPRTTVMTACSPGRWRSISDRNASAVIAFSPSTATIVSAWLRSMCRSS
jgi:hypothetical protein